MENIELFTNLAKTYGPVTAVGMFNLWIYVINPKLKKKRGTFVSYKTINDALGDLKSQMKELNTIRERVFNLETVSAGRKRMIEDLAEIQEHFTRDLEEMRLIVRDFTMTQKTTNRLLGEVKDTNDELSVILKDLKAK